MRRRAIVVVLDGLRRGMVGPETTPELHRFSAALSKREEVGRGCARI
jgi:hypothetical protein